MYPVIIAYEEIRFAESLLDEYLINVIKRNKNPERWSCI